MSDVALSDRRNVCIADFNLNLDFDLTCLFTVVVDVDVEDTIARASTLPGSFSWSFLGD